MDHKPQVQAVFDVYPDAISEEDVASAAEVALSGTFDKYLWNLRRLQLVEG